MEKTMTKLELAQRILRANAGLGAETEAERAHDRLMLMTDACQLAQAVIAENGQAQPEKPRLPADPEGRNNERALYAREAMLKYATLVGLDAKVDGLDTAILDFLCDLGHLCDRENLELEDLVRRAAGHYDAETDPDSVREDDYDPDDPNDHDISQDPHGEQFDFFGARHA